MHLRDCVSFPFRLVSPQPQSPATPLPLRLLALDSFCCEFTANDLPFLLECDILPVLHEMAMFPATPGASVFLCDKWTYSRAALFFAATDVPSRVRCCFFCFFFCCQPHTRGPSMRETKTKKRALRRGRRGGMHRYSSASASMCWV